MRKIISRLLFFCILLSVNFGCSQNLNTNNWKINFEKGDNENFKSLILPSLLPIIKGLKEKGFSFRAIPYHPLK